MIRKIGGKVFNVGSRKNVPEVKLAYVLKNQRWEKVFEGDMLGLKDWVKHQQVLADKREVRAMIADMCGTTYSAACEDMGIGRI